MCKKGSARGSEGLEPMQRGSAEKKGWETLDYTIDLKYHRDLSNILNLLVQSRYSKKKQHRCYMAYDRVLDSIEAIKGHYCKCGNWTSTVGCCSHVATTIYFLSHARYQ